MAIPGIVGTASGGITGSGGFTVDPPGGSSGWLAIAHWNGSLIQLTVPSGWEAYVGPAETIDDWTNYGIWYSNTPTPGSDWSHDSNTEAAAVLVVGYDGAITIEQSAGTDSSMNCPTVTTTNSALVTRILMVNAFNAPTILTYPTGHPDGQAQKIQNGGGGGDESATAICHVSQVSPGATGTALYDLNNSDYGPRVQTLALTSVAPTAPTVDIGADSWCVVDGVFGRVAVEDDNGSAITAREWKVMSGPADAGLVVGTDVMSTWPPTMTGSYVLRYTATNGIGSSFHEINLEVGGMIEGPQNSLMRR